MHAVATADLRELKASGSLEMIDQTMDFVRSASKTKGAFKPDSAAVHCS